MVEPDANARDSIANASPPTQDYTPEPELGAPFTSVSEQPGTRIGPYTLIEAIGEGGMGSVFRAEQTEPVKRMVALKLIKAGMDTRHVLARFEAERQALALMDHPNIAKVLDAGATAAGRPYFVMELVQGIPLTQFCDQQGLTSRQRLELFIPVCQAIQHAHQKGIIHRDIKPSNVLVTQYDGKPVPKVIDFGIAKATAGEMADGATFTNIGNIVGTPEYMSPEQAMPGQSDIDTRSDVYALGVLLYELFTGSTPHDRARLRKAALLEVLRVIRDEEPPRPSTRLSSSDALPSIAANRRTDPARLTRLMRGDLDWVVMKALEKDRERRYASASGFAADLQRYLDDEPVSAGPPSQLYRLKKLVRRNKGAVTAAAMVVFALVAGIVGTSIGMIRADRARTAAAQQSNRAQTIANFMTATLNGAGPAVAKGRDAKLLKDLLDDASARINSGQLKDDPEAEIELRCTIGNVCRALSEFAAAEDHLRRATVLAQAHWGPTATKTDLVHLDLARVLVLRGRYGEAKTIAESIATFCDAHGDSESERSAEAWSLLGSASYNEAGGINARSENAHQRSLAIRRKINPAGSPALGRATNDLGFCLRERGAYAEAEPLCREALAISRSVHGPLHPETIFIANSMADVLHGLHRLDDMEQLMRATLRDAETVFGPTHRNVADVLWRLGNALYSKDDVKAAEPLHARCLEIRRRLHPDGHKDVGTAIATLAHDKRELGDPAGAEALIREALAMRLKIFGEKTAVVASTFEDLGMCQMDQGQNAEAAKTFTNAINICREVLPDSKEYFSILYNLALVKERMGELDAAIDMYRQCAEFNNRQYGATRAKTAAMYSSLGAALYRKGKKVEAEEMLRKSLELGRQAGGIESSRSLTRYGNLAFMLEERKDYAGAEPLHREFLAAQRKLSGPKHIVVAPILSRLGDNLMRQSRPADAELVLRECLELRLKHEPEIWSTFNTMSYLGDTLTQCSKLSEAEPLLLQGCEGLQQREAKIPLPIRQARIADAMNRLVRYYDAAGKPDDAAKWREKLEALKSPEKGK